MSEGVTVLWKRAVGNTDLPLPVRMTEHSAGYDITAAVASPVTLQSGDIAKIPCGFHLAIPPGYEVQVRPRSGLSSKHGITLINSPGTIDSDYRGEVMVPLINLGRIPFVIERGLRVAQIVIAVVPASAFREVADLDDTARGHGGFGHTGH